MMYKDKLISRLAAEHNLEDEDMLYLLKNRSVKSDLQLKTAARDETDRIFGKAVYIRGLIEFTNICKNNCYYCGIRRGNNKAVRYRLSKEQILSCCTSGYSAGFRTFVLQGGEDAYFTDDRLCDIVSAIKENYPDCAVTLSVGERSFNSYKRLYDAGADRYLLRHETANAGHYKRLHPDDMSFENRMECLQNLKQIGYQIGCGFMVGSPYQTDEDIVKDLRFIKRLQPDMVGIGPFIPHRDTPFGQMQQGSADKTVFLLSIIRLLLPEALLPATTALGTADRDGRINGILHGANVVMPNLSPQNVRAFYTLYDNKIYSGAEAAECRAQLDDSLKPYGFYTVTARGDSPRLNNQHGS